jgi:predicted lipid-binding transport protein (Tim44 family)
VGKPSWESTVIASLLIGLAGAIFLVVYLKGGIDDALKAWAAIGTIGGVITGVVPAYFFGQQRAASAEEAAKKAQDQVVEERARRDRAEEKSQLILGSADPQLVATLQQTHPNLF